MFLMRSNCVAGGPVDHLPSKAPFVLGRGRGCGAPEDRGDKDADEGETRCCDLVGSSFVAPFGVIVGCRTTTPYWANEAIVEVLST